jgi:hypothetical protein
MFSKRSRYNKLSDVVTLDAKGRSIESKSIRLLPEVTGTFNHVIEEVDRLDHLAYKYYKQPVKWWRICDANPEFLSPLALLGKEPLETACFTVTFDDTLGPPPWYKILRNLNKQVGVRNVSIREEVDGQDVTREVTVTYNGKNTGAQEIKGIIEDEGFVADDPQMIGRLGKEIVIAPDSLR